MATAAAVEQPSTEARQLAMVAHLLGFANLAFALAGLISAIIMYVTAKDDFVRINARAALNMQITWFVYSLLFGGAYFFVFFTMLFGYEARARGATPVAAPLGDFAILFSLVALLLLGTLVTAIFNGIGARRAYLGRAYHYPIAIPFLRDPVFSGPGTTA